MRIKQESSAHRWKFFRAGNVAQVVLETDDDLRHLAELDQKLWMVLSMPCKGVQLSEKTLRLLDSDGDGSIRPPEILEAVSWICSTLKKPSVIFEEGSDLELENIQDAELQASAAFLLKALKKEDETSISYEDAHKRSEAFANLRFNGDGIIELDIIKDAHLKEAASKIYAAQKESPAESSEEEIPSINRNMIESFSENVKSYFSWLENLERAFESIQLNQTIEEKNKNLEVYIATIQAFIAVKDKINDYFLRCQFVEFDRRTESILQGNENELEQISKKLLSQNDEILETFPISLVSKKEILSLHEGLNPLWKERIKNFVERVYHKIPLSDKKDTDKFETLDKKTWEKICETFNPIVAIYEQKPQTNLSELGSEELKNLEDALPALLALVKKDEDYAKERCLVDSLAKLLRYRRDLGIVLKNFISLEHFYTNANAVFQAGSLYIDGRTCHLCIDIVDDEKHASLAALSGAYLVYCDIFRLDQAPKKIVAMLSAGDNENMIVGRNAIFYDRNGLDWQAKVRRIISAPISVGQAFWQPYKKLYRSIEDQIIKRTQTSEDAIFAKINQGENLLQNNTVQTKENTKTPKKLDLGAIALIGTAIGGISALVSAFFQSLFGLGLWLPLGIAAIILLISGPSMILASMKLRKRNLGPILDANNWAINSMARINIPFGSSLTELSSLAPGSLVGSKDPFKGKSPKPKIILGLVIVIAIAAIVYFFPSILGFVKKLRYF